MGREAGSSDDDWHAAPEVIKPEASTGAPASDAGVVMRRGLSTRTGVVAVQDLPGEGDGCDRLFGHGCDEERCCPSFWQDEGVPPVWPLSSIFSRSNRILNDNAFVEAIGHCGLHAANSERKALMGTALAFTVVSIVLTTFGCIGLSSSPRLAKVDAWAIGTLGNDAMGEGTIAWVGLSRLMIERCASAAPSQLPSEWSDCEVFPHWWSEVPQKCLAAQTAGGNWTRVDREFGYPCAALLRCAEQAVANQFGALVTCVTLIFALIGCLTRIRKRADTNFQKIIGTFPDLVGILTLGAALATFSARCTSAMLADETDEGTRYSAGPGFIAYCFCWVAAVVRFTAHAIMPVPGAGISCTRCLGERESVAVRADSPSRGKAALL